MQAAARSLSKRLKVPPIELALTESALRIFTNVDPAGGSTAATQSFARVVPMAVLSLLRHRVRIFTFHSIANDAPLMCTSHSIAVQTGTTSDKQALINVLAP